MKIKVKFFLSYGLLISIIGIVGLYGFFSANKQVQKTNYIQETAYPLDSKCKRLKFDVVQIQQWLTDISATRGRDGLDDGFAEADKYKKEAEHLITELMTYYDGDEKQRRELSEISDALLVYYDVGKKMALGYIKEGPSKGNRLMGEFDEASATINKRVDDFLEEINRDLKNNLTNQVKSGVRAKNIYIVSIMLALIIGIIIATLMGKHITSSLHELNNKVKELLSEDGDLTRGVEIQREDEFGDLAKSFNDLINKLNHLLKDFSGVTDRVSSASTDVFLVAESAANSVRSQTERIEQISVSMNEMSTTTADISINVTEASELADEAATNAVKGNDSVKHAVTSMEQIKEEVEESSEKIGLLGEKSAQIGQIIQVINDIAEQTNLLALNAAIEAARAGEQGRGFAVVADEVRKLAEKTSKATDEITDMIISIQTTTEEAVESMNKGTGEVARGVGMVRDAGTILTDIVDMNRELNAKITNIAAAAEEQSQTAGEISGNVNNLSDTAKDLQTHVQRNADASKELSEKIMLDLKEILNKFKTKQTLRQLSHKEIESLLSSEKPVLQWDKHLSVGVKKFDDAHIQLCDMINRLNAAMKNNLGDQIVGDMLDSLINLVGYHFGDEEKEMKIHGYPNPEKSSHLHEHKQLTDKALEIQKRFKEGARGVNIEILNFLKDWLVDHIMGTDMKYKSFFNSKGLY